MTHDLDRFRVARSLATYTAAPMPVASPAPAPRRALVPLEQLKPAREPVIHSTRGPRFSDYAESCPMCGVDRIGLEFHGTLMSGAKVHTVTAHSAGKRRVGNGEVRCLGAGMRMVFVDGGWRGEPTK